MSSPQSELSLAQRIRIMQIIVAAMAMGIVSFMGIALFIRLAQQQPGPGLPHITYIALGYFPIALLLQAILPNMMSRRPQTPERLDELARNSDAAHRGAGSLCVRYQTMLIISLAIIEGAAFLALIAYIIDGNMLTLFVAAILLGVMLAKFPSAARVERWIDEQRDAMRLGG